jgi:hypothetical protein
MVNCFLVILHCLFKKFHITDKFLDSYVKNREKIIEKCKLNGKTHILSIIHDKNAYIENKHIEEFHTIDF